MILVWDSGQAESAWKWVDVGGGVDVVCPDFSKAFDTFSYNILVMKVRKCGTVGTG